MTAAQDLTAAIDGFASTVLTLGVTAVVIGVALVMVYLVIRGSLGRDRARLGPLRRPVPRLLRLRGRELPTP